MRCDYNVTESPVVVDVGSFNLLEPLLPPFIDSFLILVFGESSAIITSAKLLTNSIRIESNIYRNRFIRETIPMSSEITSTLWLGLRGVSSVLASVWVSAVVAHDPSFSNVISLISDGSDDDDNTSWK